MANLDAPAPTQPDPEWVKQLKAGDPVDVAEHDRRVFRAVVARWTPTLMLSVVHEESGTIATFRADGYERSRVSVAMYLVPPAPDPAPPAGGEVVCTCGTQADHDAKYLGAAIKRGYR